MRDSQQDPVRTTLEELRSDPSKFQKRGGYERLVGLLESGNSPLAVDEFLRDDSDLAGDVLWAVCELDDLGPYVQAAARHLNARDPGTAAYAIEILLRAAEDKGYLQAALRQLQSAPAPVRDHAALVLAGQGLNRARDVFRLGAWAWAAELTDGLLDGSRSPEAAVEALAADLRQDRLLVGLTLATIASEQGEWATRILDRSELESVRKFAEQLRRMFEHRWR